MKIYKKIATAIILIITIALVIPGVANFTATYPEAIAAFNNEYPTEEDYEQLNAYALAYAQTRDENISRAEGIESISTEIKDGNLKVVVKSFKADVTAIYRMKAETVNDKGEMKLTPSYKDGIYTEESNIESAGFYIGCIYFFAVIFSAMIFIPLFAIFVAIPSKIVQQRNKKRKN